MTKNSKIQSLAKSLTKAVENRTYWKNAMKIWKNWPAKTEGRITAEKKLANAITKVETIQAKLIKACAE